jgi:hypothetical protein
MSFGVGQSIRGLESANLLNWQAASDDPSFVYRFWLRRPRYMIIVVEGEGGESLDPKLYVDRGNGFEESTAVSLKYAGSSIYSITVLEPRKVKGIRFDPCSNSRKRFKYWAELAWTDGDRDQCLIEARQRLDGAAQLYKVTLDGKGEKKTKRRSSKFIAEHYASVLRLAESTAPALDVSLLRDGPFISFVVPVHNTPARYLAAAVPRKCLLRVH